MRFVLGVDGNKYASRPDALLLNLRRAVELLLEVIPDGSEGRQRAPARLEFARTGHAVTLALHLHVVFHRLETKIKQRYRVECDGE